MPVPACTFDLKLQINKKMKNLNLTGLIIGILLFYSCSELKDSSIQYKIDKELSNVFESEMPGAAIIVVKDGEILYRNAFGLANVELNVKMEPDMCFKLGSVSKQFVAVAILILEEKGKLSLEDSILKFFPGYSLEYKGVKIKHLLTHTSGIKNYTGFNNGKKVIRDPYTQEELVDIILNKPLDFKPGNEWKYSNSGYTLLAKIIENITKEPFYKFIKENIFQPIGMGNTSFADDESVTPGLVNGYRKENNILKTAEYMSMTHTYGAGDIISCVNDMAKWKEFLLSGTIISDYNLKKCFTPFKLNDGSQTDYGIGWFMDKYRDRTRFYHDGGVYGFQSFSMYIADEDLYIVILKNRSDIYFKLPSDVLGNFIADIILGYEVDGKERIAVQLADEQLNKYVGVYQFVASPGKRKISLSEGKLYYERPPRNGDQWSQTEIKPESKFSFFAEGKRSTISFQFNEKNEVTGLDVNQAFGRVVKLKKIE